MTDIKIAIDRVVSGGGVEAKGLALVGETVNEAIKTMRGRLLHLEDSAHLESDFLGSMHMILLRRYAAARRELRFSYSQAENAFLLQRDTRPLRDALYAVAQEVTSNDLKYGTDLASWDFHIADGQLTVTFDSASTYRFSENGTGTGTWSIQARLSQVGARACFGRQDGRYSMVVRFPLGESKKNGPF